MKRNLYIGICLLMAVLALGGCKKAPINPDIEGHWQLLEFTTKADGQTHKCERIYYSIQLWVIEVAEKGGPLELTSFRGRYRYDETDNTIRIKDLSTYDVPELSRPAEVWELLPYGLNCTNPTFEVVSVDKRWMTLESDYAILKLKKF